VTPEQTLVIAVFIVAAAALLVLVAVLSSERRIRPRRAARPPFDGARVAGPGAVPPRGSLARAVEVEEHRTGRLVRPFLTHLQQVADAPATAPMVLPRVIDQQINGRRVVLLHRCGICRDGAALDLGQHCPWCDTSRGWTA
jgi:hypothetical protein